MRKFKFRTEVQERLASFSWWVFRRYYFPNIKNFTREDWEDIRQEIYLVSHAVPLMGLQVEKKHIYRLIHAMLYSALRRMGYIKPRGSSLYIKNYYIERMLERMCNRCKIAKDWDG